MTTFSGLGVEDSTFVTHSAASFDSGRQGLMAMGVCVWGGVGQRPPPLSLLPQAEPRLEGRPLSISALPQLLSHSETLESSQTQVVPLVAPACGTRHQRSSGIPGSVAPLTPVLTLSHGLVGGAVPRPTGGRTLQGDPCVQPRRGWDSREFIAAGEAGRGGAVGRRRPASPLGSRLSWDAPRAGWR